MRIALDAMGGDFAPGPNVEGAIAAVVEFSSLHVVLVGDAALLEAQLAKSGYSGTAISVLASEGVAGMEEKPTEALLKKPRCSIAVCWKLMAGKEVDAVVSAGSTGAVVAAGLRTRLFLKGVKRPGIAVALPTARGQSVLLDVGANPAARPEHLAQYAVMGSIYAREVLGCKDPSVGLMNIGSEDGKGNELVRETHALLAKSPASSRYIGNVEGRGLYQGEADVIVCEGFVGNVVLKVSEGMAEMMLRKLSQEVVESLVEEGHLAGAAFHAIGKRYSHHESGGAPLLGVDGICMICHGSSNARSIYNALRNAVDFQDRRINPQIVEELEQRLRVIEVLVGRLTVTRRNSLVGKIALMFPGQGAQHVGMGRQIAEEYPRRRELFDRAGAILGYDLAKKCFEGPQDELNTTQISQPAIFVTSLAALEMLKADSPDVVSACSMSAGLSLGEYTALVFAGALTFDDGLRVVQRRAEAMQAASDASPSGMVSLLLLDRQQVETICAQAAESGLIRIANYLCPGNIVVSGDRAACVRAAALAEQAGGKTTPLKVAGAFHTEIMRPADVQLGKALSTVNVQPPRISVYSNVDAKPHEKPEEIREILVRQVVSPVLWEDCTRNMLAAGADQFYEVGPGKVLRGLLKRIDRKVDCQSVNDS